MVTKLYLLGMWLLMQGGSEAISWDLRDMWARMGFTARFVVVLLFVMSVWSFAVMIDRWVTYSAARKQSRYFVQAVAKVLQAGNLDEAIKVAERNRKSHIAKVVSTGLQEFQSSQKGGMPESEIIAASQRGLDRAVALVHAELKRGLGTLATVGSTAPFVGLFGTVVGIINAFSQIGTSEMAGLSAVAGGISEALVATAIGLAVAIPAVWAFNYFTGRIESFDVEMDNSSKELVNYFILRRQKQ